ncbi:hypothetical protein [Ideonella sp.]|uniref:hypothetical protein n=1 Tax=Ideonella sp. TaxID=1929293 RepID=UPI002B4993F3|nr:hypothetical protein [Ideonella sp.]HJV71908.1 hypothetical protein [Ideonella sp.]
MNTPDPRLAQVGRVRSRVGGLRDDRRVVYRGRDLHADLAGIDWIDLYAFGITGRRYTDNQLRLMHALWVHTSYPDARIWNNRVAALAGSSRSTGSLGLAAALAVSEAHIYGRGNEVQAVGFFLRTRRALDDGATLADCIGQEMRDHGRIAGYGRPLLDGDERIAPTMALAESLGLAGGPHLRLAFDIERHFVARGKNLRLNYGCLVSAFGADLGMTPQQFGLFMFPSFLAGMPPVYLDARERPEGTLLPLPCDAVRYEGPPPRRWTD